MYQIIFNLIACPTTLLLHVLIYFQCVQSVLNLMATLLLCSFISSLC